MSAERPHHPFSPSQLASLQACASYEGAQAETPHFRTVIGSKGHNVIETRVDDPSLSDEDAAYATQAIALYEEEKAKLGDGVTELAEEYVSVDSAMTTAGYYDAALVKGSKGVILDWKLGMHKVPPAKTNLQLQAYVLGVFRAYPQLEEIRVVIFQPTCDFKSEHTYTRADITPLHEKIFAIVTRAKAARAEGDFKNAKPAFPLCSFCKNISKCPAIAALAGEVGSKFAPLIVPSDIRPDHILDPQDAAAGLRLANVLDTWTKAFRNEVVDRVLRKAIPLPSGYKVASRKGTREIIDRDKYREVSLRFLTEEEYAATLKPSLTAAEDKISENAPRGSKTETVKAFAKDLEDAGVTVAGQESVFLKVVSAKSSEESKS